MVTKNCSISFTGGITLLLLLLPVGLVPVDDDDVDGPLVSFAVDIEGVPHSFFTWK